MSIYILRNRPLLGAAIFGYIYFYERESLVAERVDVRNFLREHLALCFTRAETQMKAAMQTSPVATLISYVVNHAVVRSVLFFYGFAVTWFCRTNFKSLVARKKPMGNFNLAL